MNYNNMTIKDLRTLAFGYQSLLNVPARINSGYIARDGLKISKNCLDLIKKDLAVIIEKRIEEIESKLESLGDL